MDDEPMWVADRVVTLNLGSAITIPEIANEFAIKAGGIFLYKTLNQSYQLLKDKVLLKLDWAKNQKTKSSLKKTIAFAAKGNSNSDTNKIMDRIDAMTMKMDAQYKDFQSRSKQPNLDNDDIPMSCEEASKFMQTFHRTYFYNDYRDCDNWRSSGRNDYNLDNYQSHSDDKPDLQKQLSDFIKAKHSTNSFVKDTFMDLKNNSKQQQQKLIKLNPNDQQKDSETLINFDSDDEDNESTPQPKPKNPKPVKETPTPKPYKPKVSYPQRLRKEKMEAQYGKFIDMIRAIRINVPLIDVLTGMPNYEKYLKELVNDKHKIEQISAAFLSDESFTILQNKVPPKLGDPESFLILCNFNKAFSCNALSDLGASINLMPIAENMLVEVDKFTFPVDFVIFKMEEDNKVPLILGRHFLHIVDVVIRVNQKQLNLGIRTERMILNIDSAIKHSYSNDDTCFSIDVIDEILEEDFDALLDEGSEILHSIKGTTLKEKLFAEFDEFMAMTADENFESESDIEEQQFDKFTFNTDYKIKTSLEEPPTDLELKPLPDNLECLLAIFQDMIEEFVEVFMDDLSVFGSCFDHCLNNLDKMLQRLDVDKAKINVISKLPPPTNIKVRAILGKKGRNVHPIYFASKNLNTAQQDYTINEKELMDVVFSFDKFRSYLVLSKTIVHTDHSALRHLFKKQDAKPRLICWILLFQAFDIEIKDIKGTENVAADHLSRIEKEETSDDSKVDDNFLGETLMEINTKDDPWFANFANYLVSDIILKGMTYQQKKFFSLTSNTTSGRNSTFSKCDLTPILLAHAADSAADVLAEWNAVYDAHNEVACLMLRKQLGRLGYVLLQDHSVGLILNGLTSDFARFMKNYNMHNMGKTIGKLHALLIEYEKGLPKKVETPQVMEIKTGKIQKTNKKSLKAKGKGKANGKGKNKQVYIPKPKNPKPYAKDHPAKDDACHYFKEVGYWKRNCPVYLAELLKKKKQVGTASSSGARKLEQGALYLYVGNGVCAQVEAIGSFDLVLPNGLVICLDTYHYALTITRGVVLVSRLVDNGFIQCFTNYGISVFKNDVLYFNAISRDGIYEIDMRNLVPNVNSIYNVSNKRAKHNLDSTNLWHCRLTHISKKHIEKLQHDGLLKSTDDESFDQCVSCLSGKITRKSFLHRTERATDLLGIIHTKVCGLLRHVSRYFITFTDDYSRYGYVYLLKHKHEVFETFRVFKNEAKNQLGKTIKDLRSDQSGEYISQEFKDYLKACGIVQQLTPPYTPQHNGVFERRNRALLDMVRSMMNLITLPLSFWDYALESATRILKMVPTKKVDKTPYELWYGKVPNLSYLKETMGYYFYFPPENKIIVARYAEFFEKSLTTQEVSGRATDLKEIQDKDTSRPEITSERLKVLNHLKRKF
nr:hypothetical protein [Tanacetum cinerariifolium]